MAFIPFSPQLARTHHSLRMCAPQPPKDPGPLRSESSRRRNGPPKPLRRRRRRRVEEETLDWDSMESLPLVGAGLAPESGEDYWVTLESAGKVAEKKREEKPIDENLKEKLREEVVSPYKQNWILWITVAVAAISVVFAAFGGFDSIPIIPLPDL